MTRSLKGRGRRFRSKGIITFLLVVAITMTIVSTVNIPWAPTAATVPSALSISEWQVPSGSAGPTGISIDSTGRVWFAENLTGKLGMLDPTANNIYEWNIPSGSTQPFVNTRNIVATGSLGYTGQGSFRTYFAEYDRDRISYFETTAPTPAFTTTVTSTTSTVLTTITSSTTTSPLNQLTEYQLPTGSRPASVFVDDQDNIWFTESGSDAIGELIPQGTTSQFPQFVQWALPGANPSAGKCAALCVWGLYVQKISGTYYVWFTERTGGSNDVGEIGRLQLNNNVLTTWDLSTVSNGALYQPFDIVTDQSGNAYISNYLGNRISMLGNDGTYREYAMSTTNAKPLAVAPDPARNLLWFLESTGNNLAYLNSTLNGNILSLPESQCVMPSTITVTTSITASLTTYTTTTNLNTQLQPCVGNAYEYSAISVPPSKTTLDTPTKSYQSPSTHPLGNVKGPVNGISEYTFPNSNSHPYSLALDSYDDLWMTESDTSANRIAEVTFPTDFGILLTSPSNMAMTPGSSAAYSISVNPIGVSQNQVSLSVNIPSGLTANFNPPSGIPPFQSTLTITTTPSTPRSTYALTINATSSAGLHRLGIILTVQASTVTSSQSTTSTTPTVTVTLTTTIYSIPPTYENQTYPYIQVSSNSTISGLQFDSTRRLLNFNVTGPPGTIGLTKVIIAQTLIDGAPTVLLDGNAIPSCSGGSTLCLTQPLSNSTHYTIVFTYPHSTHMITVGGSNTIPEFRTSLRVLVIALVFITLAVNVRRKTGYRGSRANS